MQTVDENGGYEAVGGGRKTGNAIAPQVTWKRGSSRTFAAMHAHTTKWIPVHIYETTYVVCNNTASISDTALVHSRPSKRSRSRTTVLRRLPDVNNTLAKCRRRHLKMFGTPLVFRAKSWTPISKRDRRDNPDVDTRFIRGIQGNKSTASLKSSYSSLKRSVKSRKLIVGFKKKSKVDCRRLGFSSP